MSFAVLLLNPKSAFSLHTRMDGTKANAAPLHCKNFTDVPASPIDTDIRDARTTEADKLDSGALVLVTSRAYKCLSVKTAVDLLI